MSIEGLLEVAVVGATGALGSEVVGLLTERISQVAANPDRLFGPWDALASDGAARVERIAKREVVGRDRDR